MEDTLTRREHEEFAKRMEAEHQRQNHRISDLEKALEQNTKLLVSVEKLAISMESMQRELKENGERLEKLEERDGAMWRAIVKYAITAVIGIVVGFIFTRLGM